jgi:arylformamidase
MIGPPRKFRILDISRTLEPGASPWPGDTPFRLDWTARIGEGSSVNLSTQSGSPHVGTHADAYAHVRDGALGIDEIPLAPFIGPARVVAVSPSEDGMILPEIFAGMDLSDPPRLLLKTGTHPDTGRWPDIFASLAPETARLLARSGALLVGLDTPSVDPADSTDLLAHNILLEGGLCWLENLDLSAVPPGVYWLIAPPLKIRGADGSPVRALLLAED